MWYSFIFFTDPNQRSDIISFKEEKVEGISLGYFYVSNTLIPDQYTFDIKVIYVSILVNKFMV